LCRSTPRTNRWAVSLYRRRNATLVDQRPAVRRLADALEPLRNAIKREDALER